MVAHLDAVLDSAAGHDDPFDQGNFRAAHPREIERLLPSLSFALDTRPDFAYPHAIVAIETSVLFLDIFEDFCTHERR